MTVFKLILLEKNRRLGYEIVVGKSPNGRMTNQEFIPYLMLPYPPRAATSPYATLHLY